ncbi:DinB family protein [Cellulomonas sp. HZM]|uniref:DinB family protein n=1 Tax=Cellulomonas sp. HZM TaxID=1454010 RepID=UPI000558DE30|nr:DinB family protein [Cellulomonas sp. HZM]
MTTYTGSDDFRGARFRDVSLRGARFVRTDLSGVVGRGIDLEGADLDAPWLFDGGRSLLVNGVDVVPLVEAELDRRFPGRSQRRADDPAGLRAAWTAVQTAWGAVIARVRSMPAGTVDVRVDDEWSFAQTLRHLVMATDVWLVRAILERDEPLHPIGQPNVEYELDGNDPAVFSEPSPTFERVLDVRSEHVSMVGDYLAAVTAAELAAERRNPWSPQHPETVLSCLHTILQEEWEHLRYAVRDLDTIDASATGPAVTHGRATESA